MSTALAPAQLLSIKFRSRENAVELLVHAVALLLCNTELQLQLRYFRRSAPAKYAVACLGDHAVLRYKLTLAVVFKCGW